MNSRRTDGVIGPDLVVQGRLDGKSDLRIDGCFDGELHVAGDVVVGPDGGVTAPVHVNCLEVEGEVRGDVVARDSVVVRPGGRLVGDVRARRVAIDDGGALQGGVDMEFDLSENDRSEDGLAEDDLAEDDLAEGGESR